jgi:hypothetical protein
MELLRNWIVMKMPAKLRKHLLDANLLIKKISLLVVRPLLFINRSRIFFTYDSQSKLDGVGAQLQRLFSIYSLSQFLGVSYVHTAIENIAVHPLDNHKSDLEYSVFLERLNLEFEIDGVDNYCLTNLKKIEIRSLRLSHLWQLIYTRRPALLKICEPYSVSDLVPNMYSDYLPKLPNRKINETAQKGSELNVVMHYRRGVGGMVIQAGERLPRELPLDYYAQILQYLKNELKDFDLVVETDAPADDLVFRPPSSQNYLWVGSPKFDKGEMSVEGIELEKIFEPFCNKLTINRGGDPINALKTMSTSDIFIMSKSSLSMVAALLNKNGTIYYPPNFWHPPLKTWKIFTANS